MFFRLIFGGKGRTKESKPLSKTGQTLSNLWLFFDSKQ